MYHYTYEIVYQSGMRYIGSRTSKKEPNKDNYWGSSKYTPKEDKTKEKIILSIFKTREEAYKHEIYLHKYNEIASNSRYYNKAMQTSTGFSTQGTKQKKEITEMLRKINKGKKLSKEHIEKLRKASTGRIKTKEEIDKIKKANIGKKVSKEAREKLSKRWKERFDNHEGKKYLSSLTKGKPKLKEHKEKIGIANTGKKRTIEQRKTISEARKGVSTGQRSQETKDKQSLALKGKHLKYPDKYNWTNSETKEKRFATCAKMSDEFCTGFSGNFTAIIRKRYKSYHKWGLDDG